MAMFSRRKKKHPTDLSDKELIAAYRSSDDPVYVGYLFDRYAELVFLVCMKYLKNTLESEDAAMQIFEKLLTDLKRYEIKVFKGWLHTVTRHHCLAVIEKGKRTRDHREAYLHGEDDHVEIDLDRHLHNGYDHRERELIRLEAAIEELNEAQRSCVRLFYLEQKSYKEVSAITGYSLKQVKSYIQNGKRNLRLHLGEESQHE